MSKEEALMESLVYRVHPLPQSMHELLFDFGQLPAAMERLSIHAMVIR